MKKRYCLIICLCFCSVFKVVASDQPVQKMTACPGDSVNKLTTKTETLELRYIIWGCECPHWVTRADEQLAEKSGKLIEYCFYIEPEGVKFELPEKFDPEKDVLEVTGRFDEQIGIPEELIYSEEPVKEARIFRFTAYEIIWGHSNRK